MNNQEIMSVYESVAELTDQMVVAARSGDWDRLVALETNCRNRVEVIKTTPEPREALSPKAIEKKASIIKKILQDDREIRTITEPWMAKLSTLMNNTATERKLSRTYGAHQSG